MADLFLISIALLIMAAGLGVLIALVSKIGERLNQQSQINIQQHLEIQRIKEELLTGYQVQKVLKDGVEKTREMIEFLKKEEEFRKQRELENIERIKRLDSVIAGTYAKGISGENILREVFKQFPADMIVTNFSVRGKVVEFGLVLPNKKVIPIDSKWTATNLVLRLEKATSPQEKEQVIKEIEKEVIKRIKEIRQYIDPTITWSQAIAALPDSAFSVCKKAHLEAKKNDILLMPYSMVLPLLLYMYRLHLQYAQSIDIENLKAHLVSISRGLDEMEDILENKISRGSTMISNAYLEYKKMIGRIRASMIALQIKPGEQPKKLKESD